MTDWPPTSVIGAGAWGSALASLLAGKGVPTVLWAREAEVVADIEAHRENRIFLEGVSLSSELDATDDIDRVLEHAEFVVNAVPTQHMRSVLAEHGPDLARCEVVVTVAKGIEVDTLALPGEILAQLGVADDRIVALSGPSFATEVAAGQPTAVTVAGRDEHRVRRVRDLFATREFRVYSSPDIISVELGGALKNVIAIAVGIADGLGSGRNTRAAIITRGLAEMSRLAEALGGDPLTLSGLSGLGDLVLTCTGELSRNRTVGLALGRGEKLDDILSTMHEVSEGVATSRGARELGRRAGIELPITEQIAAVLHEGKDPRRGVADLLSRATRDERW